MRWKTRTRKKTGLLEHVCIHGAAHPDPVSAKKLGINPSHNCCGCCDREDFPTVSPPTKPPKK